MITPSRIKNILVICAIVGWGVFFGYMLVSEQFILVTEGSTKYTLLAFIAPFGCLWLGYHHRTKKRGQKSLSILTWLLGLMGIISFVFGIGILTDQTSSLAPRDFLPIVFGAIHLVLAYWCYENSSDENLKSSDLNLKEVLILYKEISAGKLSNFQSDKYGRLVSDAALQAVKENQLDVIANGINISVKLEEKLGDHKVILSLIMDKLSEAYVELEIDSKYELFPLFINKKNGDTSPYFNEADIQKWSLNSYEVLLKKDNLTLKSMEKEYLADTPLAKDYPQIIGKLNEYIEQQSG